MNEFFCSHFGKLSDVSETKFEYSNSNNFYTYILIFPNGKRYIGYTKHIEKRLREHRNTARSICAKKPVHKAIRSFGEENIKYLVAFITKNQNEALEFEKQLILKHKTMIDENGYNVASGGSIGYTIKWTEEKKREMSEKKKAFYLTEQGKKIKENLKKPTGRIPWNKGLKGLKFNTEESYIKAKETMRLRGTKGGKPQVSVKITNLDDNTFKIYDNIRQASILSGIPDCIIRRYSKHNKKYKNFIFERLK